MTDTVRLVTYNVNSVRARLPRVIAILDEYRPDIACLQETKSTPEAFPHDELGEAGYVAADHSGGRWEGVAVLARAPLGVEGVTLGLPGEPMIDQARWVEATVGDIRVASVYVPNGRTIGAPEFTDKLRFLEAMADRASALSTRHAVIAGDVNVCPADVDVWDPLAVHGGTHVTPDERSRIAEVLSRGFVDSFRALNRDEPGFTWWDYRAGHFHKGYGLRIDLALFSTSLASRLSGAMVDRGFRKPSRVPEAKPSDHAPLVVDFAV